MPLIMYDWECQQCGLKFDRAENSNISIISCIKCGYEAYKIFPTKAPSIELVYNPKKDIVDWDGNKTQYYRKYEEAKSRGENVRLPEEGE